MKDPLLIETVNMRAYFVDPGVVQIGGADFEIYRGVPYQRGRGLGGLFRGIWNVAVPILRSIGADVGKEALQSAAQLASDVAQGEDIKQSLKRNTARATRNVLQSTAKKLDNQQQQVGSGLGKRQRQDELMPINSSTKRNKRVKQHKALGRDTLGTF